MFYLYYSLHCVKTSSAAQDGGGSFKNRKPIGEVSCCESRMAERIHWWTEKWLECRAFLSIYPSICLATCLSVNFQNCFELRSWCALYILNSKCASRHNGVHFFDIPGSGGSKSARKAVGCRAMWPDERWKIARRCGAKHISKSKSQRHLMFGPLLEAEMSKKCTPLWREAPLEVKIYKAHQGRSTFGNSNHWKNTMFLTLSLLWSSLFFSFLLWLFPPLLFHLSILSEVWLLKFLR